MDTEKTCINCKNYVKHYIIVRNKLKVIGGHCTEHRVSRYYRGKIFIPRQDCKHWEGGTAETEDRQARMARQIDEIKSTLTDIALILKSE